MRGVGGVLVVAAALLVCCTADNHQDSDIQENSGERYDAEWKQREDDDAVLRYFLQSHGRNLAGIGGSTMLGRSLGYGGKNLAGIGGSSLLGRNLGGIGGSSLLGRNLHGIGGSTLAGRNLNGIGGSSLLGRDTEEHKKYSRFVDSLGGGNFVRNLDSIGGGNFVRNLDSIGGGNFVRNLDSIGGGNFVKKNLDHIGGPNLVKRNLDSLGGGNFVRNLDSIGGGNFVREVDSIGGSKASSVDHLGGNLVRLARETHHYSHIPYLLARRHDFTSQTGRPGRNEQWFLSKNSVYNGEEYPKRNFDEIDLSGLDNFVRKRNFDEIDQTSMPFPLAKRFGVTGPYHHDMSSFDKKRFRADYPMDEIDLSEFPMGSKRSY